MTILNKDNYDYIKACGEKLPLKKKDMLLPNKLIKLNEIERVKNAVTKFSTPLEYDLIKFYYNYTLTEDELLFVESFGFSTSEESGIEHLGLSCLSDIQSENNSATEEGDKLTYFLENQKEWYKANKLFSFITILSEFDLDCVKKSIELSNFDINNDDAYLLNLLCAFIYMEKAEINMTDEKALKLYNKIKNTSVEPELLNNVDELVKDVSAILCESKKSMDKRKQIINEENLKGKLLDICNFIEFMVEKNIKSNGMSNLYLNHLKIINDENMMNTFFDSKNVNVNVFLEICESYDDLDSVELTFITGDNIGEIENKIDGYRQLKNL